ncbi:MAG: hypothetical protein MJ016_04670, partial [Victivallaceae bacterium]|nr:hypothetical protein [Victivallaceae bacterium]
MWIWTNDAPAPHQRALFRKRFRVEKSGEYVFRISAESDFTAYCDGIGFLRGQYSDYPEKKTYTEKKLFLDAGEHLLALAAYYVGAHFQTCYPSDVPGVWCEMEDLFESDGSWRAIADPAWRRAPPDAADPHLGSLASHAGPRALASPPRKAQALLP